MGDPDLERIINDLRARREQLTRAIQEALFRGDERNEERERQSSDDEGGDRTEKT